MDPSLKNLREWLGLLLLLFVTFDLAGVQYGMHLAGSSPMEPNVLTGEIAALVRGPRGAYYNIYVTPHQLFIFYSLLGGAAAALIAMLSVIVGHGMVRVRAERHRR